jgi:hypothetical protein
MRIMSAVHPTANQKRVLAKIAASPTPAVAAQEISKDANLVAARNMLMKMGVITFATGQAALTDRGTQISTEENIIDQSGQLTPAGQELAYTSSQGTPDKDQTGKPVQQATPAGQPPTGAPPGGGLSLESFSLLKELLR